MLFLIFFLLTPGSYFPSSSFCHFKRYLPFAEMHGLIWGGICETEGAFLADDNDFSSYQPRADADFVFVHSLVLLGPEVHIHLPLVSPHLPRHINFLRKKKKMQARLHSSQRLVNSVCNSHCRWSPPFPTWTGYLLLTEGFSPPKVPEQV